jgi:hypothetical protein
MVGDLARSEDLAEKVGKVPNPPRSFLKKKLIKKPKRW